MAPEKRNEIEDASPAKLYATLVGGLLVVAGIVGFFYSASFGSPGEVDEVLGLFSVNGWSNVAHLLAGALGLFLAGFAARRYAFWLGIAWLAIALWGFVLGSGAQLVIGLFPVNTAANLLHLALGLLGVGAALGTSRTASSASRPGAAPKGRSAPARPSSQTIN